MTVRQASCVVIEGRAVLIEGEPGIGKSSLALALMDRGAQLVGDDGVELEVRGGALFARPHPALRGLLEVRNLGILPFPVCDGASVALVVRFDPAAERFIERAEVCEIAGVKLPLIRLWLDAPILPLKVELALRHYGLPHSRTG